LVSVYLDIGRARGIRTGGKKGERRPVIHERLLYYFNVNRTSLDHLLLGKCADVDKSVE
jgi:hypothetical protein